MKDVCQKTGLSPSSIRREIRARTFPEPVKSGCRILFVESEVEVWMEDHVTRRDRSARLEGEAAPQRSRLSKEALDFLGSLDEEEEVVKH
jgi:predicted DNA-binding transcriptional regulator AlpA